MASKPGCSICAFIIFVISLFLAFNLIHGLGKFSNLGHTILYLYRFSCCV